MNAKFYVSLATALSLLLLAAAFGFQHIGGYEPCELCIWQRWPHAIALFIGVWAIATSGRWAAFAGMAVLVAGAGVAFYHVGVEQGIFRGLESCSSSPLQNMTGAEFLDFSTSDNFPQDCSQVAWSMLGLSMAAWNGIFCLLAAALWSRGAVASRPA